MRLYRFRMHAELSFSNDAVRLQVRWVDGLTFPENRGAVMQSASKPWVLDRKTSLTWLP